tara:strand:+ start:1290 stop:1787 length:498 start_codon:yes stop_codon:yes gene_type:complete
MRTISATTWSALASQETGVVFITLLEIDHDSLDDPIYASSDPTETFSSGLRGTTSDGTEFLFFPFDLILPSQEEDTPPRARLSIDNVDREIVAAIREASGDPISVTVRVVTDADKDTSLVGDLVFALTNVSFDATTVSGDLSYEPLLDEPFPEGVFGPSDFPGLF